MSFSNKVRTSLLAIALCVGSSVGLSATAQADARIDTSPGAQQQFYQWWNIEIDQPEDQAIGQATGYKFGIEMCEARLKGMAAEDAVESAATDSGYTPRGASGLYSAATKTLCPVLKGYKSYFDKEVDVFAQVTGAQYPFNPPMTWPDYAVFIRHSCQGFRAGYNHTSILPWLRTTQPNDRISHATGLSDEALYQLSGSAGSSSCSAFS